MPRHSPCALYSLTIVEETRSIPLPPFGESFLSAPSFSSFAKNRFLAILGTGDAGSKFLLQRQRNLVLLNYAGFTKIFGNCNRYPSIRCSTIKFTLVTLSRDNLSVALLACHTLFSFQGANPLTEHMPCKLNNEI